MITTVSICWLVTKNVSQIDTHFLDIDECLTKTHGCDANAVCHNTEGSFICKCKAGYVRNGQNCVGKELICFMTPQYTPYSKEAADLEQVPEMPNTKKKFCRIK